MQTKIIWQQGSDNPENGNNLAMIKQWWTSLHEQQIAWRQRLIPQTEEVSSPKLESRILAPSREGKAGRPCIYR